MNIHFNRRHFVISFGILSVGWLVVNYAFFASKGQLAFHSDFASIVGWAWEGKHDYIKTFGIYMPIIPYIMSLYGMFNDSLNAMLENAVYIKTFFILIDAISFATVIALLPIKSTKRVVLYSVLIFVNFSLIYNSIFWGQVDNLHSLLIFGCCILLLKKHYKYVWGLFSLAVFTKIVSVIFLPIILLFILNELIVKRLTIKEALLDFLILPAVSLVVFIPIIIFGNVSEYVELTKRVLTEYDSVTSNAYNIYYLISNRTDLISVSSQTPIFRAITFGQFGLVTFSIGLFFCLFPIFRTVIQNFIYKKSLEINTTHLILAFALTPLLFFFFTTKIRERFSHPYLIFLTFYCFYNRRFIFWYLATFIYFLQLESVLEYTRVLGGVFNSLLDETNIYHPIFVASLFATLIIYLLHLQLNKDKKVDRSAIDSQVFKSSTS